MSEQPQDGEQAAEAGESGGISERTAQIVLVGVGLLALWGIVAVLPEIAYFVAGIMACRGWQRARGWITERREGGGKDSESGTGEVTEEELIETLHEMAAPNVFLADLAAALGTSTAETRTLLEARKIRVRRAVRNGDGTGVGVHRDDLPPLPRPLSEEADRGVDLHNQRPTVEPLGLAGVVVKDGNEAARQHRVRSRGGHNGNGAS